jgi:hypothetical protein
MFYELGVISVFNLFLSAVCTLGAGYALRDKSKTDTMTASAFVVYLLLNGAVSFSKRFSQALELILMIVTPHLTRGATQAPISLASSSSSQPSKNKAENDAVAELLAAVPRKRAPFPK